MHHLIFFIIRMASFWFFIASLLITFPLFSSSSAALLNSDSLPLSDPFEELSPDIAPLLPSPGETLPSPAVSSLPTISSTPSPPNPDDDDHWAALGPDSAFSPFPASCASPQSLVNSSVFVGCISYWLLLLLKM
ncbi:classical arabinogalactan protein 25 [Mercurialis annua]|uniref:classical arabinogalactan protein 25 n=1 Tax=Mercurialis annua TaxID=3986 RepID=UPI0021602360|nr:classical arabinogalactan protein 25 [Mercurialis annua]